MSVTPLDLGKFDVTKEHGFLPRLQPYRHLPIEFKTWDDIAHELPELLAAKKLGPRIHKLPRFNLGNLRGHELQRAHVIFSFIVHGYVWELWQENKARTTLPADLAIPYVAISKLIGMPPILSYASYALNNWRLLDREGPVVLGNLALLQYFLGGLDEAWFTLVHVEIEAQAGEAIVGAVRAQEAALENKVGILEIHLFDIYNSLHRVNKAFNRMPESCDQSIYFKRVRPWIHGWKTAPHLKHTSLLPDGLIYEGVDEFGGKPQEFRGETGAQSSIFPLLDAAFGVVHAPNMLSEHLIEMRDYMPPKHRALICEVEKRPAMREYVRPHKSLYTVFNLCLDEMWQFRNTHYEYAAGYINKQARNKDDRGNSTEVGTGGTPFMASLKKHMDETLEAKV